MPFPVKTKINVRASREECLLHAIEIPTSRKVREKWGTQFVISTSLFRLRYFDFTISTSFYFWSAFFSAAFLAATVQGGTMPFSRA